MGLGEKTLPRWQGCEDCRVPGTYSVDGDHWDHEDRCMRCAGRGGWFVYWNGREAPNKRFGLDYRFGDGYRVRT